MGFYSTSCDFRPPHLRSGLTYGSTKIRYQMIPLSFYHWNQFKVIPRPVHSVQETYPQIFCDVGCMSGQIADITQSQAASNDRLLSHVTLGRVECRK